MKLGEFELLNELGRGGAGVVFRARAPSGEIVALKVLIQAPPERLARFRREERLLRTLGLAEGFVPLLDVGESPRGPFFVMPLLDGGTLRDAIKRGAFSVEDALECTRTIALAVSRAHSIGIVHRDLKPENVLFSRRGTVPGEIGRPFVADLGLAKHFRHDVLGASQSRALTHANDMLGTLGYMAPEQTTNPAGVGPPADVFALGTILYELLAGESPFDAESAIELLSKSGSGEFVPLRRRRPDVPVWLAAVVETCLSPSPSKRPEDAAALARALEGPPPPVPLPASTVALLVAGAILLLGAGVAAGLAFASRHEPTRTAPSPSPSRPPSPQPSARPTPSPPRPSPSPSPERHELPAACASFLETRRTRLVSALGNYTGKNLAMVQTLKPTPDGKGLVSCSLDGWVVIWDLETGEERFARHVNDQLFSTAISADGKTVVAGDGQGRIHVFDTQSTDTHSFESHKSAVYTIDFAPDGASLWTAGAEGDLIQQDLATGARLATHSWGSAACPLPGFRGFVLGRQEKLALASLETETLRELDPPVAGPIQGVALSPDGKRALTGTAGGSLVLWDLEAEKALRVLEGHHGLVSDVAFSPDGKTGLSCCFDATGRLWDLATGDTIRVLTGHAGWFTKGVFTLDGKRVVTGGNDQTIRVWDPTTGRELWHRTGHAGRVSALASFDEGRGLLSAGVDSLVHRWDVARGIEAPAGAVETWISGLAATPDGSRAVSVGGGGRRGGLTVGDLVLWDPRTSERLAASRGETGWIRAVALRSPTTAITVGDGAKGAGELVCWRLDPSALAPYARVALPARSNAVAVAGPTGRVAAALEDGTVALWTGEPLAADGSLKGDGSPPTAVALSPDGDILAVGYASGLVALVNLEKKAQGAPHPRHRAQVSSLLFLEDGRTLASGSLGGTIVLSNVATGAEEDRIELGPSSRDGVLSLAPLGTNGFAVGTIRGVILQFELTPR